MNTDPMIEFIRRTINNGLVQTESVQSAYGLFFQRRSKRNHNTICKAVNAFVLPRLNSLLSVRGRWSNEYTFSFADSNGNSLHTIPVNVQRRVYFDTNTDDEYSHWRTLDESSPSLRLSFAILIKGGGVNPAPFNGVSPNEPSSDSTTSSVGPTYTPTSSGEPIEFIIGSQTDDYGIAFLLFGLTGYDSTYDNIISMSAWSNYPIDSSVDSGTTVSESTITGGKTQVTYEGDPPIVTMISGGTNNAVVAWYVSMSYYGGSSSSTTYGGPNGGDPTKLSVEISLYDRTSNPVPTTPQSFGTNQNFYIQALSSQVST